MREKLLLRVYLAATQATYEVLVPYELTVGEVASLVSRLLGQRASPYYTPSATAGFMLLEHGGGGDLLGEDITIRELMCEGVLVNGSRVTLV